LRGLRHAAVRVGHQIRRRLRLAELFPPINGEVIAEHTDHSHGMTRGSPLQGMRQPSGPRLRGRPRATGLRYCINSAALKFDDRDPEDRG
jgi:peptide-methionine (R)-S-oxide reductase